MHQQINTIRSMANSNLRLKDLCKAKGITQAQLAERIGIKGRSLVQAVYRGSIGMATLIKLADELGVTIPELFETYTKPKETEAEANGICPHCGKPLTICVSVK